MGVLQGFVANGNDLALGPVEDAQYIEVPSGVADTVITDFLSGDTDTVFDNATRTVSIAAMVRIFDRAHALCLIGGDRGSLDGDEFDVALARLDAEIREAGVHDDDDEGGKVESDYDDDRDDDS